MTWTDEDKQHLLDLKTNIDSDDVRYKEYIKKALINNKYIIHVLNNKELEEADAEPDDYYGVNILPRYIIPETQTNSQNYLCYEVATDEIYRYDSAKKTVQIYFYILCEQKTGIDDETGIARHDLLAALILNEFNWSNYFGFQVHCVSDKPSVTDNNYATRTMIFEGERLNSISKTSNGTQKTINNRIKTLG